MQKQGGKAASGETSQGAGPNITVQEQPAQVTVETQQPHVVVTQPAPAVSIQQPKPRVSVQQTRPQVQVQEAPPRVSVEKQGQPSVEVQQTKPQVQVQEAPPRASDQRQDQADTKVQQGTQSQANSSSISSSDLMQKTADQLRGKEIVDLRGKDLGEVDKIVREKTTGQPYVVLKVGGFFGIGDESVTLPLSNMALQGDKLVIPAKREEEQLKRRKNYQKEYFTELQGNTPISAQIGASGASQ